MEALKILLVEDNRQNRLLVEALLQKSGHNVTSVRGGREALDRLEREDFGFDVVLLDIQLPEVDGYEVVQRIRGEEKGKHLCVVALTSYAMPGDRHRALKVGFNGYIEKPIEVSQFTSQVAAFHKECQQ